MYAIRSYYERPAADGPRRGEHPVTGADDLGTIRALVCEDEPLAVRAIREYLRDVRNNFV